MSENRSYLYIHYIIYVFLFYNVDVRNKVKNYNKKLIKRNCSIKNKLQYDNKVTTKWGDTEQWGDIKQPYSFHGNSLKSAYNSYVTRCLWFRLHTQGFCSYPQPQDFWNVPKYITVCTNWVYKVFYSNIFLLEPFN